jgi:hypothetical protein
MRAILYCNFQADLEMILICATYWNFATCMDMATSSYLCAVATELLSKSQGYSILGMCATNLHNVLKFILLAKSKPSTQSYRLCTNQQNINTSKRKQSSLLCHHKHRSFLPFPARVHWKYLGWSEWQCLIISHKRKCGLHTVNTTTYYLRRPSNIKVSPPIMFWNICAQHSSLHH